MLYVRGGWLAALHRQRDEIIVKPQQQQDTWQKASVGLRVSSDGGDRFHQVIARREKKQNNNKKGPTTGRFWCRLTGGGSG